MICVRSTMKLSRKSPSTGPMTGPKEHRIGVRFNVQAVQGVGGDVCTTVWMFLALVRISSIHSAQMNFPLAGVTWVMRRLRKWGP